MNKTMHQINVETKDGLIILKGPQMMDENGEFKEDTLNLAPEQVDGVIKWLIEAKDELLGQ